MKKLLTVTTLLTALLFTSNAYSDKPIRTMQEAKEYCAARFPPDLNKKGYLNCVQLYFKSNVRL